MSRTNSLFALILALGLLRVCSASQCAPTTPISASLIGRSFSMASECYRPSTDTLLSIFPEMIVLKIERGIRIFTCPETYLIRYRTPDKSPMIIKYPELGPPSYELGSYEEMESWCRRSQRENRVEMFPVHQTRFNFTDAVSYMMPILREIREFECEVGEYGMWERAPRRGIVNADVQAVMTYLDTIAFQYSLCV